MNVINLEEKLAQIDGHWQPHIVAELNGQHVKLAKLQGEFIWHAHEDADELFMVVRGELTIRLRNREVTVKTGEIFVVPRGVEHLPAAAQECHVLLFEPAGTLNTGNVENERTVANPERI